MENIQFYSDVLYVNNGVITGNRKPLVSLANEILAGSFGKFNNGEVYPDRDYAIAKYVEKELTGR
jgi:hypothetical protein